MKVYQDYNSTVEQITDVPSVMRIQDLETSLQKAFQNISILQSDLSYVIQRNEQLQKELQVKNKREEALKKQFQRELFKKEKELQSCKQKEEEILNILEDAKNSLQNQLATRRQRQDQMNRKDKIIQDQQATNHSLEEELLTLKYSADLSFQNMTQQNMRVVEMQKENDQLNFEIRKIKGCFQKQKAKSKKFQKEVDIFKAWLGKVLGVRKVVEGCESMLMQEISNRLNNTPKA